MVRAALRLIFPVLLVSIGVAGSESVSGREKPPELGPPLQAIQETEETARLLAILLDSGRYVINENQDLFDDPKNEQKGFSPEVFEQQLIEVFRSRSGIDLHELQSARLPRRAKEMLTVLDALGKKVVAEAQPEINNKGVGFKGFSSAIFGLKCANRFT